MYDAHAARLAKSKISSAHLFFRVVNLVWYTEEQDDKTLYCTETNMRRLHTRRPNVHVTGSRR